MFKKRNKILLIDDATDLVQSLAVMLEGHEYEVEKAYNGKQGLKKLETYEPDLIILDMDMPVMGGIEFYHTFLNQNGGKCKYPVLVFTGRESLESVFKDLEVEGFMSKPFDFEELIAKIDAIFLKRYGHQEPASPPPDAAGLAKIPVDNILVFERNEALFDQIVTAFANEDIKVEPGLSDENVPAQRTLENALHRIKTKNSAAVLIHIESFNPLARCYEWIRPAVDLAMEKSIPVILFTDSNLEVTDECRQGLLESGAAHLIQTSDPHRLLQETLQSISQ